MLNDKLQGLVAGDKVELIEVDGTEFGADVLRYHAHPIKPVKAADGTWATPSIEHDGKTYAPWPYELSGLAIQSNKAPSPTLSVSNIKNTVSALCLLFDNMYGAKVTIINTLAEFLAQPDECKRSTWYIEQKTSENDEAVTFSLSSPADVGGLQLPSRVMTTQCAWALRGQYRGATCGYTGAAMFNEDGEPVTDPSKDQCGGRLGDCRKRFEPLKQPLRHGGFPSVGLIRE